MNDLRTPEVTLVTGANGFVARHVIAELVARGGRVIATGRQDMPAPGLLDLAETYLPCDLTDLTEVRSLPFGDVQAVINLAGLAAVGESFSQPHLYLRVNAGVIDTVCHVVLERNLPGVRIIAVSSGAVYAGNQQMPLTESSAVDTGSSPYAASKLAMEDRAEHYRRAGLDCVVVRPFNHIGPGQSPGFLVPDLLSSIRAAQEVGEAIQVGNLSTRRDYTDVRDVAAAYIALIGSPRLDQPLYNVCSGRSRSGTEILAVLLERLCLADLAVETDQARLRPSDQPEIMGDNDRLISASGWAPTIPLERSIADFLDAAE